MKNIICNYLNFFKGSFFLQIPLYFFIALIATLFYAIGAVYSKLIMDYIKNPVLLMIYQFTINLIVVFIVFVVLYLIGTDFSNLLVFNDLIVLIISSIFIFLGILTFYYGLNIGNVSVATIVLSSRVLFVIPLGILFLNEFYPSSIYFWIIIIVLGIFLVSWKKGLPLKDVFMLKGTIYFILTNIFWAIANSLITYLHNDIHFVAIIMIRLVVLTTLIFILAPKLNISFKYIPLDKKFNEKFALITFFLVLVLFMGDLGYIYALGETVTITEAIGSLQGIFVFIMVLILSKIPFIKDGLQEPLDRKTITVRITGIFLATIGTLAIAIII